MKKLKITAIALILVIVVVVIIGTSKNFICNGEVIGNYGILNVEEKQNGVVYGYNKTAILCAALLFQTVIVPVYVVGWNLYEPISCNEEGL